MDVEAGAHVEARVVEAGVHERETGMQQNWRWVRLLGSVLTVLGFGSAIMRTKLNMDTVLTQWMGGAQPVSGIAMGVIGLAVAYLAIRKMREAAEAEAGAETAPDR
jgi:glutamate mutase epsilon subunit